MNADMRVYIERFSYPHLNFSFIFFSLATDVRTELVLPFAVQSVFNATDPPPCLLHNGGTNECIVGEFNRKNVTIPDVFSQGQFSIVSIFPLFLVGFFSVQ